MYIYIYVFTYCNVTSNFSLSLPLSLWPRKKLHGVQIKSHYRTTPEKDAEMSRCPVSVCWGLKCHPFPYPSLITRWYIPN